MIATIAGQVVQTLTHFGGGVTAENHRDTQAFCLLAYVFHHHVIGTITDKDDQTGALRNIAAGF